MSPFTKRVSILLGMVAGAGLAAAAAGIAWFGAVHTGTTAFCVSCHSMQTPYAEYRKSAHFSNKSGVRVGCADCHVPRAPLAFVTAKLAAAKDVWAELTGVLDTPQKFAAAKLAMAQRVWDAMAATDSRECRACHAYDAMTVDAQRKDAKAQHPRAISKGETCIACHKGLVHTYPDMGPITELAKAALDRMVGSIPAGSTVVRTLEIKPVFTAADGETTAARVLPGAPLALVGIEGPMARVRIAGWRQEGAERVIYAAAGKRILVASLVPAMLDRLDTTGEAVTLPDTGQTWSPASLEAWLPVADVTADSDALWGYASTLYAVNCAMCHAAPHVDEFSANEWLGQFRSMVEQANLGREDRALVQTWLQLHGRDADGAPGH
jgi:trimethylamine-N-oxide reductase cytochrome c-type subunit TorC